MAWTPGMCSHASTETKPMPTATVDSPERAALNQAREDALALADKLRDMRKRPVESRTENWKAEIEDVLFELDQADREYNVRQAVLGDALTRGPRGATQDVTPQVQMRTVEQCFFESEAVKEATAR